MKHLIIECGVQFHETDGNGASQKIRCIKAVREALGINLKEAKDFVEINGFSYSSGPILTRMTDLQFGRLHALLSSQDLGWCSTPKVIEMEPSVQADFTR